MATQTTSRMERVERRGSHGLEQQGLQPRGTLHWNLVAPELIQAAIRRGEGELADMGPFVGVTSPHTGRSPNDKFVVEEAETKGDIWWGKVNRPFPEEKFDLLLADVRAYLDGRDELFVQDLHAGADPKHRLQVRYVTPNAWHAAFVRNMFIRPDLSDLPTFAPNFTVLHAPDFEATPERHGTRTGTFIILKIVDVTLCVRADAREEQMGLDLSMHGEEGYNLES